MKKNHSTLWKAWLKVAACAFFALAMACSDGGGENDIPEPTPPAPTPDNTTGSIDFNLKGEDGSSLPTQEPINVGSEEGLELVISQKSSYTDPNGQVYTCEPKASITLEVKTDTVYAKDLKALTAISGTPSKQTESSGTNPVKKQTLQSFSIGGQDVVFDLSHEIYTYTNSKQKKIEMPYIQVGEAKFGKGEAAESKSASSPVTLRSLAMSRASLTDSTLYEVNAKFNLELATVNTKESQKQTLNFDVKYLAVVENVTELTGVLEYDLDQKEYNLKGGEETIVVLEQDSKFANGDVAVYTSQPQASVSLKAEKAQVFVGSVDELKSLIDTEDAKTSQEGSNPITHSYQKKYATKNQSFEFATSYQVCFTQETGEEMPYLKVNEPELIGIEATAKGSRASVSDTTYYDVKATFSVELEGVNVSEEHKQTLTFTVDYEGAVVETIPLTPSLTYTLDQTEYTLNGGEEKEIIITQASQFKNGDQAVFSYEPMAMIKFMTGKETVYADNVEALKKAVAGKEQAGKTGSQPLKHTYSNTWNAGGQTFTFENFYEVYTSASGDEMPYLKVNEPELIGIEATAKGSRASMNDTTYYDVKATFSVELEGVNVSEEHKQTLTFTVDYEGAVVETIPLTPSLTYTLKQTEYSLNGGDEKEIIITQVSQYKNGEQAVFSYEPAAVIKLIVGQETVYADNVEALKKAVAGMAQTEKKGSQPLKHTYSNTWNAGGQTFTFENFYEVYTSASGDEMPYLKVNEPELVGIKATELGSRTVLSDTTYYNLKAIFSVKLECVNVEEAVSETFTFTVNYTGAVVKTTSLTPVLEYTLETEENSEIINRGNLKGNKFIINETGLTRFNPTIQVKSAFLNGDSVVQQYNGSIYFTFDKSSNDMRAESMEQLKTLIETEDATVKVQQWGDAQTHTYEKTFSTYGMDFHFESSYSVNYPEGYPEMPYLKVGEPKLVSIETVEAESRVVITTPTTTYKLKATFEVELTPMNIDLPAEKLTIELNYEGAVGGFDKEVGELVSTSYRKDMIYMPPKGNLLARAACVVYRDRKYSDNSVQTDSIYGGNWFMLENSADVDYIFSNDSVKTGVIERDYNEAGIYITTGSVEVPDLEKVKTELSGYHMNSEIPGGYSTYSSEDDNIAFDSSNPVEEWYVTKVVNNCDFNIVYGDNWLVNCRIEANYYDRFLYIDGRIIDFAEYRPSWDDGIFSSKNIDGGIVYTLECKGTYVGQEVHMKSEVTITEKK